MKIAMYGGFPPPLSGQTLSNKILYSYLKNKNHKIDIYDTAVTFNKIGKFSIKKVAKSFLMYFKFLKYVNKYDIVYTTMGQSKMSFLKFLPIYKICRFKKIPYIVHLHGNLLPQTFNNSSKLLQNEILYVLNNSKSVIVLSEILKNQLLFQKLSSEVKIVKNFVEDDYFISFKKKKNIFEDHQKLKLFYLSNLMESKGILDVLKAALILKRNQINFELKIAGLWQEKIKKEGKNLLEEIGEEYVQYLGFIDGEKKRSLIHNSHIFLLPTYYPQEGQPISILEAMAGGNIIITTKHSGIPDIVQEGKNGFFVSKKAPKEIAESIKYIKNNFIKMKEISNNNIYEAKNNYTIKKFGSNIEKIITNNY